MGFTAMGIGLSGYLSSEDAQPKQFETVHFIISASKKTTTGQLETHVIEHWVKGENYRTEIPEIGGKQVTIGLGKIRYEFKQSERNGTVEVLSPELERFLNPLGRIAIWKQSGVNVGVQMANGVLADKVELNEGGWRLTVWFSQDNGLPVMFVYEPRTKPHPRGIESVTSLCNVKTNVPIAASMFELPEEVTFMSPP